jgi:hypothetical protein
VNETAKTQATRMLYINEILEKQALDGGWNLTAGIVDGGEARGDADITGMALQALSNYQENAAVKTATEKALELLSEIQESDGGFSNTFSQDSTAAESAVQVAVALCELGISVDDPRFVKNGHTVVDYIISLQNADGSFNHTKDDEGNSQLSSEQAFYGLVAVKRAEAGQSSLYDMTTVPLQKIEKTADYTELAGLQGKHTDVKIAPAATLAVNFSDIKDHENRAAIENLAQRGIISGKSATLFDPNATMTRTEFAAIIMQALSLPEKNGSPFTDVPGNAWYAAAVSTAYYYEILSGVSPTAFHPNGTITRQEAAVMIARAAKLCGMDTALSEQQIRDTLSQFSDYRTAAEWAQSALAFCYKEALWAESDANIRPQDAVLRSEVAVMVNNMLKTAQLAE